MCLTEILGEVAQDNGILQTSFDLLGEILKFNPEVKKISRQNFIRQILIFFSTRFSNYLIVCLTKENSRNFLI